MTPRPVKLRPASVGTIDAAGDTVVIETDEAGIATFSIDSVNAPNNIVLTFEAQYADNGPWFTHSVHSTNVSTHTAMIAVTAAITGTAPIFAWVCPVFGAKRVRARCTVWGGGSVVVRAVVGYPPL